ncbi:nitrogen fixation protein FixH, partial [Amaricoccus sp. HAR-UPW-R2A-40]
MSAARPLTGRKVLAISAGIFGVVLAANLTLTYFAINTFSGLVVENSYVSSQTFDRDRHAQEALGWTLRVVEKDDVMRLQITDAQGRAVHPPTIKVVVGRPTMARSDRELELHATPEGYAAEAPLEPDRYLS